jgi:negative regulator of sigma E activity
MSDLLNEQLSALMDGELPPEETALLMRRLEREPELAERLSRYRAIGDVLRNDRAQPSADFASRVSAAVAREPAPAVSVRRASRPARWRALRPVMGLGVAADVGALAVVLIAHDPRGAAQDQMAAVTAPTAPATAPSVAVASASVAALPVASEPASYVTPAATPAQLRPISGAMLANYVASHARMSGSLGGRDVLIHLVSDPSAEDGNSP